MCDRTVPPGSVDWEGEVESARGYVEGRTGRLASAIFGVFVGLMLSS